MGLPNIINKGIQEVPSLDKDPVYVSLVERFPLRSLINKKEHDIAKSMFLSLIRIKKTKALCKADASSVDKYLNALKIFIKEYEDSKYSFDDVSPAEILQELMEKNGLTQSDFENEIGKQPIVSKILNKKASLNAEQIKKLCKRFHLSSDVFLA